MTDPFYSSAPWRKIRRVVLARSAMASTTGRPQCAVTPGCTNEATAVDHIVPIAVDRSKALDITNLRPACRSCNSRRVITDLVKLREAKTAPPPMRPW